MHKLAWVGIVATVLFAAVLALYFVSKADRVAVFIYNETPTPIPNASQTIHTPQVPQPPPSAVKPPFNASSYEVNYTLVFTVSFSGITIVMEGWMVIGTGPSGNYSFGMLTVPLQGTATFKSATEGNATYTMTCFRGDCTVNEEKWPFAGLIEGVNVTRVAKGQCRWLNYTGTLYEERGMLDPKAFSRFIEGLSGNYTAYVCEVNGVMLSADLAATASAHGEMIHITLKMEAVKAGPYRPDVYRLILNEIKAQ